MPDPYVNMWRPTEKNGKSNDEKGGDKQKKRDS